jgi:SnoaL-like domain
MSRSTASVSPRAISPVVEPIAGLVRRWALAWVTLGDVQAAEQVLAPEYRIRISGTVLDGRAAYVEGGLGQIERFEGWTLTVHELIFNGERVAVRFTLHGADRARELRRAAWGGVAMFRTDGHQLTECFAEEDYFSRRRQLAEGRSDAIAPPGAAPWNVQPADPSPEAEATVRDWLADGRFSAVALDDGAAGGLIDDPELELHELFSAGEQVAFHGRLSGSYAGGLDGCDAPAGASAAHDFAGLVTVADGQVRGGRVIRDRLGMLRALSDSAAQ